nr:MFS transporter [Plantibacter sp. VKM Ac-2885]
MASSLGITEGQAGQAVTATAFIGFLTAPTIGILVPRLDRRLLLVLLAAAAAVSSALVAISADFVMLLIARLLLGAALGAFWAMSIAIAARLSAPHHLGRAIMLVNTGTTVATVAGVPVGTYLGSVMDWRLIFAGVAVITAAVAVALRLVLPPVAPAPSSGGLRSLVDTLRVPGIRVGLTGHILTVLGHFIAFTYIPARDRAGARPRRGRCGRPPRRVRSRRRGRQLRDRTPRRPPPGGPALRRPGLHRRLDRARDPVPGATLDRDHRDHHLGHGLRRLADDPEHVDGSPRAGPHGVRWWTRGRGVPARDHRRCRCGWSARRRGRHRPSAHGRGDLRDRRRHRVRVGAHRAVMPRAVRPSTYAACAASARQRAGVRPVYRWKARAKPSSDT